MNAHIREDNAGRTRSSRSRKGSVESAFTSAVLYASKIYKGNVQAEYSVDVYSLYIVPSLRCAWRKRLKLSEMTHRYAIFLTICLLHLGGHMHGKGQL